MKGVRADLRLFELGLADSREKARSLIMSGEVYINEVRVDKPGENVACDAVMTVRSDPVPFVSRGGLKLEKPVSKYDISLENLVAVDVGASTGGFTDCMLKHGARKVYSVDVGYGQLDWSLRNDERVVVMERRNARFMEPEWFPDTPQFASVDVSFISIKLILPPLYKCLADDARAVVLIKPQFEAGKGKVGKNGVVREEGTHEEVVKNALAYAISCGFTVEHIDFSPITGPKGNIEFLMVLCKRENDDNAAAAEFDVAQVVREAHEYHKNV